MATTTRSGPWRTAFRPLTTTRGWTAVTHHLLGLPLGVAYFAWLVTGISVGLGLFITLLGIPILTLVLASVRPLLELERGLANALLGTELPRAGLGPGGTGRLGRLKAYWTDAKTWRGVGYLLARLPVGIVTFMVAVAVYTAAVWLIAAPLLAPLDRMDFGFWEPNTMLEGLSLVPLGLALLVAAGWISEGMASMSRALVRLGARA